MKNGMGTFTWESGNIYHGNYINDERMGYGEMYWTNGVPSDFNDFKEEYLKWESQIRLKHNLKQPIEYYEIKK